VPPLRSRLAAATLACRNENVRRVELAWGAAISAEWAYFVALGVFAYDAGGTLAVGLAGLIRLLPAALVAPGAAALGDRFRREWLLLCAALLGAVALAGSAVAAFAGFEGGVLACAALVGISSTLIRPTLQALLPSLTRTPEELVASNAATSTVESLGTLIGPLVASVLVEQATVGVTFAVAAAVLTVGVVLILRVRTEGAAIGRAASRDRPAFAWRTVVQHPGAPVVVTLMVAQAFVRGCLNVLIVVAAFELLGGSGGTVGLLTAAIGAGGVIGAIASSTYHGNRLARVFAISLFGWGLPIVLVAPSPELAVALVLLAIVGASNSVEDVSGFTLLQRAIRDDALSGVLGLIWGAAMGALALGSIATPILIRELGARTAFVLVGFLLRSPVSAVWEHSTSWRRRPGSSFWLTTCRCSGRCRSRRRSGSPPSSCRLMFVPARRLFTPATSATASTSSIPAASGSTSGTARRRVARATTSGKSRYYATCRGRRR
jgi:MFS family permease